MSHVWAGDGGVLDWQEEELDRMAGDDWKKREAVKMTAWIKPKMAHKQMVQRLLQVNAHLIVCLRAEKKIEMVKDPKTNRMVVQERQSLTGLDGWIPVCEKNLPFEATASFLLTADRPGIPQPIKLQEQHRKLVDMSRPLDETFGLALARWAHGSTAPAQDTPLDAPQDSTAGFATAPSAAPSTEGVGQGVPADASTPTDAELVADIEAWVKKRKFDLAYDLCRGIKDEAFRDATKARIDKAKSYVDAKQSALN
jgi:hypothetical protein